MADLTRAVLLLADIQPDFMPGGKLPVANGADILTGVNKLLDAELFPHTVATQDWHPPGHISFASSHDGRAPFEVISLYGEDQVLWPDHCIQGTDGAALHADLHLKNVDMIVRKGWDPRVDSYSGFRHNWNQAGKRPPTGLGGYLSELGIEAVYVCGLARDVCVTWTAEDAATLGFNATVIWDLTRPVEAASDDEVRRVLAASGVRIVESAELWGSA